MSPKTVGTNTIPDGAPAKDKETAKEKAKARVKAKAKANAKRKAKILQGQSPAMGAGAGPGGSGSGGPTRAYHWMNHRGPPSPSSSSSTSFTLPPNAIISTSTTGNSIASDNGRGNGTGTNKDVLYLRDHLAADRALAELHASLCQGSAFSSTVSSLVSSTPSAHMMDTNTKPVLGFDLEWRPRFNALSEAEARRGVPRENPVALVQLATRERVWLVQICAMSREFCLSFTSIL